MLLQIKVLSSAIGLHLWIATPFGKAKLVTFLWQADGSLFTKNKRQPVHEKVLLGFQLSFESVIHALFELHTHKKYCGRHFLTFANIFLKHVVQRFFVKISTS